MGKKPEDNKTKVIRHVRDEMLKDFNNLKKRKEGGNLTKAYLDYEQARDRKANNVLKTIENMKNEVLSDDKAKQLMNSIEPDEELNEK